MVVHFKKKLISFGRFETAGLFAVNGNGQLEIVSGAYWYEKPDVSTRHPIGPVQAIDEYFDDLSTIPMDVNGDGRLDVVAPGKDGLYFFENLGDDHG